MPVAVQLQLEPDRNRSPRIPSPAQVHGAVSALFDLSDEDHHAQEKAWAIQPPWVDEDAMVIRFSWFGPGSDRFAALEGTRIRFGPASHRVGRVDSTSVSHRELAATVMQAVTLRFESPTWFSRNGRRYPLPDPVLVYRSLERRWAQGAPEDSQLPAGLLQDLSSALRIIHVDGRTESMRLAVRTRVGFVGYASYEVPSDCDNDIKRAFGALSRLATYAGVGAETPWGAGAVTLIDSK